MNSIQWAHNCVWKCVILLKAMALPVLSLPAFMCDHVLMELSYTHISVSTYHSALVIIL